MPCFRSSFSILHSYRRALGPAGAPEDILHNNDANIGGVLLAVELASASPDSIVHPGQSSAIIYPVISHELRNPPTVLFQLGGGWEVPRQHLNISCPYIEVIVPLKGRVGQPACDVLTCCNYQQSEGRQDVAWRLRSTCSTRCAKKRKVKTEPLYIQWVKRFRVGWCTKPKPHCIIFCRKYTWRGFGLVTSRFDPISLFFYISNWTALNGGIPTVFCALVHDEWDLLDLLTFVCTALFHGI